MRSALLQPPDNQIALTLFSSDFSPSLLYTVHTESSMGLVVSGVCLALYDDEDIESIKVLIRDNNT